MAKDEPQPDTVEAGSPKRAGPLEEQHLVELYKLTVDEIHKYHSLHQRRVGFFSGLAITLIAATVTGLLKSIEPYHFAAVTIGPIILIFVCLVAIASINGIYRLLLETITVRAKLDQILGLTDEPPGYVLPVLPGSKHYWEREAIVPKRYLDDRRNYDNSANWFAHFYDRKLRDWGTKRWTTMFFGMIACVAGPALLMLAITLALGAGSK